MQDFLLTSQNVQVDEKIKNHINSFNHLIVQGEEERVILPFVGLCVSDDLPDIPESIGGGGVTFSFQYFMLEKTELSCFSYESLSSLANECSLRDILHGPHSPAHLLCSEELQPHSETNNNKAIISSTSRQEH